LLHVAIPIRVFTFDTGASVVSHVSEKKQRDGPGKSDPTPQRYNQKVGIDGKLLLALRCATEFDRKSRIFAVFFWAWSLRRSCAGGGSVC